MEKNRGTEKDEIKAVKEKVIKGGKCLDAPVYMKKRRPIWLKEKDTAHNIEMSYFSEKLAALQNKKQEILNAQKVKFGRYMHCQSKLIHKFDEPADLLGIYSLQFSPKGKYLITGFGSGHIKFSKLTTGNWSLMKTKNSGYSITNIRFHCSEKHTFYTSSTSGKFQVWKKENHNWDTVGTIKEERNEINAMDINSPGTAIVTGGKDATIRIYDPETLTLLSGYKRNTIPCEAAVIGRDVSSTDDGGHVLRIFCLKFDLDQPNIVISGGWDNIIKVWDIRVGRYPVRNIFGPHICGDSLDIMDNKLLSGQWSTRDSLQLWDLGTGRLIKTILPDNRALGFLGEFLYVAKFMRGFNEYNNIEGIEGDLVMAGGSGLGGLEVLSIKENAVLATYPEMNPIVGLDQMKDVVSFGGTGDSIHFVNFIPSTESIGTIERVQKDNT